MTRRLNDLMRDSENEKQLAKKIEHERRSDFRIKTVRRT